MQPGLPPLMVLLHRFGRHLVVGVAVAAEDKEKSFHVNAPFVRGVYEGSVDFLVHTRVADKKVRAPFLWRTVSYGPLFTNMMTEVAERGRKRKFFRMIAHTNVSKVQMEFVFQLALFFRLGQLFDIAKL